MSDTKIEMKIDEEIKPLKELCEKMTDIVKMEVAKGVEKVDTKELGEAVDMINDLANAKAKTVEACYYKYILGAMESAEEEPEEMRGYRSQPRSKTSGRYMSYGDGRRNYVPEMYDRDMPMMMGYSNSSNGMSTNSGNMSGNSAMSYNDGYSKGYEDGMSQGRQQNAYSMSRYDRSRRGYMDAKNSKGNSDSEKQMKAKELDKFMNELTEDMKELVVNMSPEEKTVWKHKIQKLNEMVQ